MNAYRNDIFTQTDALKRFAEQVDPGGLPALKKRLEKGEFDRIIISGMGASYYAAYPAYIHLGQLPIPVMFVNAAELVNYLPGQIGPRTLLWLNSQSGRSAELVHLLQEVKRGHNGIFACVNDPHSPLAEGADYRLLIQAGEEATVSVKTYTNMLAANLLAAMLLSGAAELETIKSGLKETAEKMRQFLADAQRLQAGLARAIEGLDTLFLLGRGASMAAVWMGSLIHKEAAKWAFEGMHAADFRHGPLEMVRKGVGAIVFSGDRISGVMNRQLSLEIQKHGGQVTWIDSKPDPELDTFLLPETPEIFRPLLETIPMQLLTLVMAEKQGFEAGVFHIVGKVTRVE